MGNVFNNLPTRHGVAPQTLHSVTPPLVKSASTVICSFAVYETCSTGFFSRYSTHGNPFDDVYVEDEVEDVLAENGVSL